MIIQNEDEDDIPENSKVTKRYCICGKDQQYLWNDKRTTLQTFMYLHYEILQKSFIQHCIKYGRIRALSVNSCIGTECSMLPLYGEIRFRENAYSGIYFLKPTSDYIVIMDFLRIPMANKWKEQGKTLWTCSKVLFLTSRFRRTYK